MSILTVNKTSQEHGFPATDLADGASQRAFIAAPADRLLVTGASGFIGARVVANLISRGFRNLLCFVRPSSNMSALTRVIEARPAGVNVDVLQGNLLSRSDCAAAARDAAVIFHLAAGIGEKSFPDAFMNSVVTTRNLLDASVQQGSLRRFVLVSSFCVYGNRQRSRLLDESSPVEACPERRGEAYCYAKVKQEELVAGYHSKFGTPYVVVRPGAVYGPGRLSLSGRVGIDTFGLFMHLGGSNSIPLTYVDNCADAIALAGLVPGIDGEVFNIVDDDLPSSRTFLRQYKKHVKHFPSVYVPHVASYLLCYFWEKYSDWSRHQLPPSFNRSRWRSEWKPTRYSNKKLKARLGWRPIIPASEALRRNFAANRDGERYA